MSKTDFTIVDFEREAKANPYTEHVKALAEAGEGKALTITVPKGTTREGASAEGRPDRTLFQNAARDAGFSARVRKSTDNGDGTVSLTFTLGPAVVRKGKDSTNEAESATVESDVATE